MQASDLSQFITDPSSAQDAQLIREQTEDILLYGDNVEKQEYLALLSDILAKNGTKLENGNVQLFDQYQGLWVRLAFGSFINLSTADQNNLLEKRLLFAIENGLEPSDLLKDFYSYYEDESVVSGLLKALSRSLEKNDETLGNAPIEIEGKRYAPAMKYWILDYSKFPSKSAHRSAVERLNYSNQSPNTRQLTQVQRQSLLKFLKLYDDLVFAERPVTAKRKVFSDIDLVRKMPVTAAPVSNGPATATTILPTPQNAQPQEDYVRIPQAGSVQFAKRMPDIVKPPEALKPASATEPAKTVTPTPSAATNIDIQKKLDDLRSRLKK